MGDVLEYSDILQEVRGAVYPGRLKLQSNAIIFKNLKSGRVDQFAASEVDCVAWLIRARGYCLKIVYKNGHIQRFDGFKEVEYEKLSGFIKKYYNSRLEKKDLSLKGWNWGEAMFIGDTLDFKVDGNTAFEIPLTNVSQSTTAKNEVTMEFHQNDDAAVSLMELRFHIPSDNTMETDNVQEFYKNILSKADIIQATGDALTTFTEIQCLTPRGRYDIKIYPTFLQLHGKTFDYKIPYNTVLRLFLLPHRDNRQIFFVVSLDPPIKQGQTRYHFLILLFNKDVEINLEIQMPEEEIAKKYGDKLKKNMSGLEYEVISRLMKVLVNQKITVPGSFMGHSGTHCVACSYKAATGFLYPLERGFIFVHKPPVHVRFDEVASVNYARSAGSMKSFDFEVETKTGNVYTFVGIEKEEYGKLYDFVSSKKLRVKNISGSLDSAAYVDDMSASDDDTEHDAYLERMKAEGKERDEDEEDSEDESDVDYKPEGKASEPEDEYDSNAPSNSDSDDDDKPLAATKDGEKKKKKKQTDELPDDEPILSTPTASEASESESAMSESD